MGRPVLAPEKVKNKGQASCKARHAGPKGEEAGQTGGSTAHVAVKGGGSKTGDNRAQQAGELLPHRQAVRRVRVARAWTSPWPSPMLPSAMRVRLRVLPGALGASVVRALRSRVGLR